MNSKHYLSIVICILIISISSALFYMYYRDFVSPESYIIGNVNIDKDYKKYQIDDYISDKDILFCKNLKNATFTEDGLNTHSYLFRCDPIEFDGTKFDYNLFLNDVYISFIDFEPGHLSGLNFLSFKDVNGECLEVSSLAIHFNFYSTYTELKFVHIGDIRYFNKYLETNDLVVTLAKSSFAKGNSDFVSSDLKVIPVSLNNQTSSQVHCLFENSGITYDYYVEPGETLNLNVYSNTSIYVSYEDYSDLSLGFDGTVLPLGSVDGFDTGFYFESDCTYLNINIKPVNVDSV